MALTIWNFFDMYCSISQTPYWIIDFKLMAGNKTTIIQSKKKSLSEKYDVIRERKAEGRFEDGYLHGS